MKTTQKFIAVQGQDVGTCESLGWAWLSVRPMVVAVAETAQAAREAAEAICGHDDVDVHEVAS